jgi:predicted DNA-binding helix-hairpin-helix protein
MPNFNVLFDPKCNWALNHLEEFPVEVNRASYYMLLRVPGIGTVSARRIINARRFQNLNFDDLKKLGVVLKRAVYFIVCSGKRMYPFAMNEDFICRSLLDGGEKLPEHIREAGVNYRQLSLFDDFHMDFSVPEDEKRWNQLGQI